MQRSVFLLAAALLLGGLATWLTASWLDRAANATATVGTDIQTVRILVASTDLKPGDTIGKDMLTWQLWPQAAVRQEHLLEGLADPASYSGAMVRMAVPKGDPLLPAHLVKRGDQGIMAALIAPGHRAVTLAVTASSGLAGFVGPGDRVDILLTASLSNGNGTRIVGQTVVESARVLGIDQRVDPVNAAALQGDGNFAPPGTVTLEVTPKQAEAIAVAQELGKLSLSLRDLKAQRADPTHSNAVGKTWDTDVTQLPSSAFATAADALGGALTPSFPAQIAPLPAAMQAAPPALGSTGTSATSGAVEQVNGVEIVRGSSNREAIAAPAVAAASQPAAQ